LEAFLRALAAFLVFALIPVRIDFLGIALPLWLLRIAIVALNYYSLIRNARKDLRQAMKCLVVSSRFKEIEPTKLFVDSVITSVFGIGIIAGLYYLYEHKAFLLMNQMVTDYFGVNIFSYYLRIYLVLFNPRLVLQMLMSAFG